LSNAFGVRIASFVKAVQDKSYERELGQEIGRNVLDNLIVELVG
jgi:hypothetical protein